MEPRARQRGGHGAALRPASLSGIHIGLLANGKVNSRVLLVAIGDNLRTRYGAVIGPTIVKSHASLPAAPEALDTFASSVAIVLSAIGD